MDRNSQLLVKLLSDAIHDKQFQPIDHINFNWDKIYKEAFAHQIHTLLYPAFDQLETIKKPGNKIIEAWKKEMYISVTEQLKSILQIKDVLGRFHDEGIPVIPLKGLLLRNYYPKPELRTMGDIDLLVQPEYLKQCGRLLESMSYTKIKNNEKHTTYHKSGFPEIEIHRWLSSNIISENAENFTANVWENAFESKIYGIPVLIPSPEDQMVHLLLHMAEHIKTYGFGLRQLCDFTLFTEKNKDHIDLEIVRDKVVGLQIKQFALSVFAVCKRLFDLVIPDIFIDPETENSPALTIMINDIIKAGVYGKGSHDREADCLILKYSDFDDVTKNNGRLKKVLPFLFPSVKKLSYRYRYVKKFPFLLPVAWLHRALRNIYKRNTIRYVLFSGKKGFYKEHSKLLHWLELH